MYLSRNHQRRIASVTQWLAIRERLEQPNEAEQDEQDYFSEKITSKLDHDPEDYRPRKKS
jgi:hypothetical protein|tara:strand:+ start:162 stop:341 length:180 start_codon:yes stop_codon:yes gene_type:complete